MRRWRLAAGTLAAALAGAAAAGAALAFLDGDGSSATGDLIAYSCEEPGNRWYAICVVRSDGSGHRQLTHGLEASDPDWAPDGRSIVFTRHRSGGQRVSFHYDELFAVEPDGGGLRQLTDNRAGRTIGEPSWSPDGSRLAFVSGRSLPVLGITLGAVYVMDENGASLRRITEGPLDTSPAWSPDGSRIAFTRATGYGTFATADLYVVEARGGEPRRLTATSTRLETEPAWSPDGRTILFATSTARSPFHGRAGLRSLDVASLAERPLLAHRLFSRYAGNLAWSPDGRTVALELSRKNGCTAIALMRLPDGRPRFLTSCATASRGSFSPAWQPRSG
jgi:Tol biopolymer transport system component